MRLVCGESKVHSSCHGLGMLLLWFALQCSVLMTVGIKLQNVTVPAVVLLGHSASIECQFHLESDKLYSLKWYKDGHEFYRYHPNSRPNIVSFPRTDVLVDKQELHNAGRVTLRSLSLNSTGVYKCEVSSESPFFQTLSQEKKLTVIIPPSPVNPRLSKFSQTVYMYHILNGNCTSYKSFPAANLTFYINDMKWTGSNVTSYEPVSEIQEGHQVWTTILGLSVRVDNNLFNKGAIRIKCVASILGLKWETRKNITHQNKNYQPPLYSSGRNQYSSGSCFTLHIFTATLRNIPSLFYLRHFIPYNSIISRISTQNL